MKPFTKKYFIENVLAKNSMIVFSIEEEDEKFLLFICYHYTYDRSFNREIVEHSFSDLNDIKISSESQSFYCISGLYESLKDYFRNYGKHIQSVQITDKKLISDDLTDFKKITKKQIQTFVKENLPEMLI